MKFDIVRIDWEDPSGPVKCDSVSWQDRKNARGRILSSPKRGKGWQKRGEARNEYPAPAVSVGILIRKTKRKIVIARTLAPEDDDVEGTFMIPVGAIRKIQILGKVDAPYAKRATKTV